MDNRQVFVIVGASLTGARAAETLRAEGFTGRVVLIGEETERPYERPPLSKGYLRGKEPRDAAFVHDANWYGDHDVELLLGVRATSLDPGHHTLILDGFEPLRYDKLLLATGSRVRRLDVPGADLRGVRYLRTMQEADALRDELRPGASVVVIGAGWIGLEVAAAARERGASVQVVELEELPLRRVLGDEVAPVFAQLHQAHGVDLRFSSTVTHLCDIGGHLTSVVLSDGTELPANVALVAVGIVPATELASVAGLQVEQGIVTDAGLRTSAPDIFAAGDVANAEAPLLGRRIRVDHWSNAWNSGPAAARSMLGQSVTYDPMPYFFTQQYDMDMEYAGWAQPGDYDRVVFRGDPSIVDGKVSRFIAFWIRRSRVLAGMNVNVHDVQDDIQRLVRAGHAGQGTDVDRLTDPSVPLGEL